MWPLHARTKDEYIRLIEQFMDRRQLEPLGETLRDAFEDYHQEEDFSAWCASVAFGHELPDAPALMAEFMEKFPLSMQPVQVDYAEQLIWNGYLDEGANEARAYLHRVNDSGMQNYFEGYELIRDAVSRALIMLTSVYTEAGARSYSRRVIEYAMVLQLDPYWQQRFRSEHNRLSEELQDSNNSKLDELWEGFFQKGINFNEVLEITDKLRFPILRKRLEIIAGLFAEDPQYKPDDDEIFQLVYETDKGAFILA